MINQDKWIESLPNSKIQLDEKVNQIDNSKWTNTISKGNTYNVVKKYSVMTVLFVCGLLLVSAVKNETRNLEKEINNLRASNETIKFNLSQALLDHEVITSPENISKLAKEYLGTNFITYKKEQIANLNISEKDISKPNVQNKKLSKNLKVEIVKEIEKKKTELKKLQDLYSQPETIPDEIKTQVAKKIEEKRSEIKKLYASPKEVITLEKAQRWAAVQFVKVFLGIPVIPGK